MHKRLYRLREDEGRIIAGVCGGVAEYLGIDPTAVRAVWAVVSCFAGAGVLAYIAAMFIIPEKPRLIE